jgi:hypothetical protein
MVIYVNSVIMCRATNNRIRLIYILYAMSTAVADCFKEYSCCFDAVPEPGVTDGQLHPY